MNSRSCEGEEPRTTTGLSYLARGTGRARVRFLGLARRSLAAVFMSLAAAGCLYPDLPAYETPEQTPPILFAPLPPATEILSVVSGEVVNINVKLRSEDAGEGLMGVLYLNYQVQGRDKWRVGFTLVSPGSFEDERTVAIDWLVPERSQAGSCEQLTLLVTHLSNLENNEPVDDADVSTITWWVSINGVQLPISQCPGSPPGVP